MRRPSKNDDGDGRARWWPRIAAIAAAGAVALIALLGGFNWPERYAESWRIAAASDPDLLGPEPREGSVVVIGIDDAALDRFGEWSSWDRARIAGVVRALDDAGAAAIALDLLFLSPTTTDDDAALARAIASSGPVVLAGGDEVLTPMREAAAAMGVVAFDAQAAEPVLIGLRRSTNEPPAFGVAAAQAFAGVGDDDAAARSDDTRHTWPRDDGNDPLPWPTAFGTGESEWRIGGGAEAPRWSRIAPVYSIALATEIASRRQALDTAWRALMNEPMPTATDDATLDAIDEQATFVSAQLANVPTEQMHERERALADAAAYWTEHGRRDVHSVEALLAELRDMVGGRLAMVGWTATGAAADVVTTPWGVRTPGVLVHAALAEGLLDGVSMTRTPTWLDALLSCALGLIAAWIALGVAGTRAWIGVIALIAAWACAAFAMFAWACVLVTTVGPTLAMLAAPTAGTGVALAATRKQRDAARRVLRGRVSREVERELRRQPRASMLPAERREITVAFFDLAGFSSTAERLGDDAVTPFVNHAMRTIAAEVRASGGYVNKFLGDGLLALWNAPAPLEEHATAALCAAVRVRHALGERRPNAEHGGDGDAAPTAAAPVGEHASAGLERSPVRVGVATGEALVGDFGAPPELMDYTAIGRVVNDAAHLEQAAKSFGAWCLLSAADGSFNPLGPIGEELRDVAFTRPVGPVLLRGRRTPRSVFELLTPSASRDAAWCVALAQATREAVDAVDEGHIVDARQRFASIVERFDDPVAKAWMAALGDIDDPARVMLTVNR